MKKEVRTICFDEELRIEAYCLEGIVQPFPNHFHDHYVVGYIEKGKRRLSCKNKEYLLDRGSIILFNPGDNHACAQVDGEALDYRALNIPTEVMREMTAEITRSAYLPDFSETVLQSEELLSYLHPLHQMIMCGSIELEKEECFWLTISFLVERYGREAQGESADFSEEVQAACNYMEEYFTQCVKLDELCRYAALSKSALLRAFTKRKGITPYRYLQAVRINHAKKLLEQGVSPMDTAFQTGFSDQSHFTNTFSVFIGLTPGAYRDIFRNKDRGQNIGD